MSQSREAEKLRLAAGGKFHPMTGYGWALAPVIGCAVALLTALVVPYEGGSVSNLLARYTPAIAAYIVLDTRMPARWLSAPETLTPWATRALVCEEAMLALGPRLMPDRPRGRQWRQVARILTMGFWGVLALWLVSANIIGSGQAFLLAAAFLACLRLWYFQHLTNWWRTLELELDRIMDDWENWNDPEHRAAHPDPWEAADGESFSLVNPWNARAIAA